MNHLKVLQKYEVKQPGLVKANLDNPRDMRVRTHIKALQKQGVNIPEALGWNEKPAKVMDPKPEPKVASKSVEKREAVQTQKKTKKGILGKLGLK